MTEKELITQLQELRKIQPRKEWVAFAKTEVLGDTPRFSPFMFFKPALAGALTFGVLAGLFFVSQNALPDELLYPIKKISEKTQRVFISKEERPEFQLNLTAKRLSELQEIVEKNDTRKLSSALSELEAAKINTDKEISKFIENEPDSSKIVSIIEKDNTNKTVEKQILTSIGIENEEGEERIERTAEYAEYLIKDLKNCSLTEEQKELLTEAEKCFEESDYSSALVKALEATQIQIK